MVLNMMTYQLQRFYIRYLSITKTPSGYFKVMKNSKFVLSKIISLQINDMFTKIIAYSIFIRLS